MKHNRLHFINKSDGFTLVELLAVMIVFVALSSIITSIIVSALRGNTKTNALNIVQSNGNYAISQITKAIRNATTLLAPFPCGTVSSPTATSAVKFAFPDGTTSTYSCRDAQNNLTLSSNSAALIDTTSTSITACSFTCGQDTASSYPIINVDFSLQSKTSSGLVEQKASSSAIEFQTSVVIRNLIR